MDENRLFDNKTSFINSKPSHRSSDVLSVGCAVRPGPDSVTIADMGAMVKRDRNHPSIIIWSFCNEAGCEGSQEQGGPAFREIAYHFDGSRELPRYRWHLGCILLKMPQRYFAGRPRAGQHVHVQRPALVRAACQSRLFSPDNHHAGRCPLWLG